MEEAKVAKKKIAGWWTGEIWAEYFSAKITYLEVSVLLLSKYINTHLSSLIKVCIGMSVFYIALYCVELFVETYI